MNAPKCRQCGKKLRPHKKSHQRTIKTPNLDGTMGLRTECEYVVVPGQYDLDDLFCTLRCGYAYGVRAARRARPS